MYNLYAPNASRTPPLSAMFSANVRLPFILRKTTIYFEQMQSISIIYVCTVHYCSASAICVILYIHSVIRSGNRSQLREPVTAVLIYKAFCFSYKIIQCNQAPPRVQPSSFIAVASYSKIKCKASIRFYQIVEQISKYIMHKAIIGLPSVSNP